MYINLNHYKIHILIFNDQDLEDGRNIILILFFKGDILFIYFSFKYP
jgi:hypothetical protein